MTTLLKNRVRLLVLSGVCITRVWGQTEDDTNRVAEVPNERYEVFRVPTSGAILTLRIKSSDPTTGIMTSNIRYQDTADTSALWVPVSTPPCGEHLYQTAGTKYAGREWVGIEGTLGSCGTAGPGAVSTPSFLLDVPAVDLVFNNKSVTVADGGSTSAMTDPGEETDGAEIRLNADFDEAPAGHVEDYLRPGIIEDDPDLLVGTLHLLGGSVPGQWRLIVSQPNPAPAIVYWKNGGTWTNVVSGTWQGPVTTPVDIQLRVEGVDGSANPRDVEITAEFMPTGRSDICRDVAKLTVVKIEFMVTFDDGPYHVKTPRVLDALTNTWVAGHKVKAAFFQVGQDGSESSIAELWPYKEGVDDASDVTLAVTNAGHVVGNHTEHHQEFDVDDPVSEVVDEILWCSNRIQVATGQVPATVFRPPYLVHTQNVLDGAAQVGYQIVWGKTFGEWNVLLTLSGFKQRVRTYLKGWNTREIPRRRALPAVLIFHDYRDLVYDHINEVIDDVRDHGFVLDDFDSGSTTNDYDYYQP